MPQVSNLSWFYCSLICLFFLVSLIFLLNSYKFPCFKHNLLNNLNKINFFFFI